MRTHTSDFKNEIKRFGRELDSKITYGTTELGKEQLNSVTPHYESSLLKSVMKQLDIDSNVEIPLETIINYQFGVKVGNSYEYLNYGNYVVYKVEKQEDTRSWKITCYDKMLYAMKDYESLGITYPITIKNYLSAICTKLGLTLASDDFVNANKEIASELYLDSEGNSLGYTYRDVLDEIAQVVAGIICINNNDEVEVRYPSNAGIYETVEGTNLQLENVDDVDDFSYELKGNTVQDGTPSPDSPVDIQTVTGRQEITINEQSYEINLDNIELCKIGDYQDKIYKQNGKWYLYKEVGKVIFDGDETEGWSLRTSSSNRYVYYMFTFTDYWHNASTTGYSNFFNVSSVIAWQKTRDAVGIYLYYNSFSPTASVLYITTTLSTTENDFKTWLGNNNVVLYYQLQTPTTTEITDTELINQLETVRLQLGINNITVDSANVPSILNLTYLSELEIIDEEMLKDVNVNFGEVFGPVNSVVLSRSAESDNIYRKDDESIDEYGLTEIKIKDNQILNGNNRDEFIDGIFDKLNGLEYYVNDYVSTGIAYLELGDFYKVKVEDNYYKCLMLNDELDVTQGLEEPIYAEGMEYSETDYKHASKTDRTINQAYIIAKKNDAEIQALASKVVDVSNTISGIGSITLENAYEGILHRLEISGAMNVLYPSTTLTPKPSLIPIEIYLIVDGTRYILDIDYLNYTNAEEHDTFVYEDGKCWIERINGTIEEREHITILVDKDSEISIEPFPQAHLFCEYLLDNKYTSTFANQVEVSSELNLLADTLEAKVSQVADQDGNVTSASIILAVNNDSSSATIEADKININGIVTANENFKILADGSMETKNATFSGIINGGAILVNGNFTEQDPYIEVEHPNSTGSEPIGTSIWSDGISCYNYGGGVPVIRTENGDGFAELSGAYIECTGTVTSSTGVCQGSLEEKKKNFEKFENALNIINDIDVYKYNYKQEKDDTKKHIGLVIGDNFKYSKEVTSNNNDSVDIYSFVSVCCKAIQELQKEIEELRKEIK